MIYQVNWINLWKSITKFMSLAISVPVILMLLIRIFNLGYDKAFEHLKLWQIPLFLLGIIIFSATMGFIISFAIRFAFIKIEEGNLSGRNYWFFKKTIPVKSITNLYPFSNNGIEAIVADAGKYGKVYISTHTERLDELIEYIESNSTAKLGT
ncbi:MAG: hypothetical protein OEY96_07125 [Gammaproteobacteria bacterium]|nr:hypothetical protein [Gammaproteobacteria bacterium]